VIRVPGLDRGRLAARNVAVNVDVNSSGLYLLDTKEGQLERLYAHNEITADGNSCIEAHMCPQDHRLFGQPQ